MLASFPTSACTQSHPIPLSSNSPQLCSGGDLQLLDWLTTYTFPAEAKFEDLDYAERVYTDVVKRIVASGVSYRPIAPFTCPNRC